MIEPVSAFTLTVSALIKSAPHWLTTFESITLSQGKQIAKSQGKKYFDKRRYVKHMRLALENAARKGIDRFDTLLQRDQYRAVIDFLAQPGPNQEALLREALSLLTLSQKPDFDMLSEKYNLRERIKSFAQNTLYEDIDATPYLNSFFEHFKDELFADELFKQQISDVITVRSSLSIQQSLTEIATTFPTIKDALTDNYTDEQFASDVQTYLAYVERTFRYLKIVGIVPKDQSKDPELQGIFIPLRIILENQVTLNEKEEGNSVEALLEQHPNLVLLGGPGSGKSTTLKHLAWLHAATRLSDTSLLTSSFLSRNLVPLRFELRRFNAERKGNNSDYTFLSYALTQLRREGIEINSQMFKRLLADGRLLLLFDGLDEVATLDERKQLVQEIEGFIGSYSGNRCIVTSRPVGYELAHLSNQIFVHARVQNFNDDQIRQFLECWYTYVLRLSPLPDDDRQELEELYRALKENTRLHKLAENPLLLTVITPLHRYERLPDKRVQVYDRCAEILLETWAKLRGTKDRWRDIQLSKDDQFACVAFLGYVLHKRSQEGDESTIEATRKYYEDSEEDETATDVPSKFILKQIKHFLNEHNLIIDVKSQNIEAERLLELMQVEAGVIVERGTNEYNENLYGFVHRTFQEYFAAASIYEQYQQEIDLNIISDFLIEHLHDPHWREVILLLLGKLKRKPLTILLRQILDGQIKSGRSHFQEILQQDFFFVCDCLAEEMSVENELEELIFSRLRPLTMNSLYRSQSIVAAGYLGELMLTRQYAKQAQEELTTLINDPQLPIDLKIDIASAILQKSEEKPNIHRSISQILLDFAQRSDLPFSQRIKAVQSIFSLGDVRFAPNVNIAGESEQQAIKILLDFARNSGFSIEQRLEAALSIINAIDIADMLDDSTKRGIIAKERRQAIQILLDFAQRADLSLDQRIHAARILLPYSRNPKTKEQQQATQLLLDFAQCTDLPLDQRIDAARNLLSYPRNLKTKEQQQATQLLLDFAQRADLPLDQRIDAARSLLTSQNFALSTTNHKAIQILLDFAQRADLPLDQRIHAASSLLSSSNPEAKLQQQAAQLLLDFAQRADLPINQRIDAAQAISSRDRPRKVHTQAIQILQGFMQNQNLTVDQRLYATTRFIEASADNAVNVIDSIRVQALNVVLNLLRDDAAKKFIEQRWENYEFYAGTNLADIPHLISLIQNDLIPIKVRNAIYEVLTQMIPYFNKITEANLNTNTN